MVEKLFSAAKSDFFGISSYVLDKEDLYRREGTNGFCFHGRTGILQTNG